MAAEPTPQPDQSPSETQFTELFQRLDELDQTVKGLQQTVTGELDAMVKGLQQMVSDLNQKVIQESLQVAAPQADEVPAAPLERAEAEPVTPLEAEATPTAAPPPASPDIGEAGWENVPLIEAAAEPPVAPVLAQQMEADEAAAVPPAAKEIAAPVSAETPIEKAPAPEPPPQHEERLDQLLRMAGVAEQLRRYRRRHQEHDLRDLASEEPQGTVGEVITKFLKFLAGLVTVARVGILVLILGLAFLIQFATSQGWLSIELRLSGAALIGIALTVIGWRLRSGRRIYALTLQGGGIGILYLIVFAGMQLYQLLPATLAFVLLTLIAVFSALLAVAQNAPSLAVAAVLGGFAAPILVSSGVGGNHVTLFSYYLVLNFGIVIVSWFKAWRYLNLLGFTFTFVIGAIWGGLNYRPELFASTEPFLIAFFLFYLFLALLYAFKHAPDLRRLVDSVLVFGLPTFVFSFQIVLVRQFEYGLAWSAFALALIYLGLAWLLFRRERSQLLSLLEAFLIIGLVFTTLVLPFALDATWTGAGWALEGAALLGFGLRRERLWLRASGLLLLLASVLSLLYGGLSLTLMSFAWSSIVIGVAGLVSAFALHRFPATLRKWETGVGKLLLPFGLFWWSLGGLVQIIDIWSWAGVAPHVLLLFLTATAVACSLLSQRLRWSALHWYALALLPLMILVLVSGLLWMHPFANLGWLAWPVAIVANYWLLHRSEDRTAQTNLNVAHLVSLWFVTGLAALETSWLLSNVGSLQSSYSWELAGYALAPILVIFIVSWPRVRNLAWLRSFKDTYLDGLLVIGLVLIAWMVATNLTASGGTAPLTFLPILNPLDLAQLLALTALIVGFRRYRLEKDLDSLWRLGFTLTILSLTLLLLSAATFRTIHHWLGVPFEFNALFATSELQTALSILWTVFALAYMVYATRSRRRTLWLVGQGLLGVAVLKLFIIDLAKVGTVARIISFVVVGLLLLLIAYLTPVPPRQQEAGIRAVE